jgi:uncharacterized protein (DUF2235 family)
MARRLVVCADGTWNTRDQVDQGHLAPTNVVKLCEAVSRRRVGSDGAEQLVLYHDGVGAKPNVFERAIGHIANTVHLKTLGHNLLSGVTGTGLDRIIKDCYRWLIQHYQEGDQLFLFGFSRGAYTVRSLAGLVRNCGLLTAQNEDLVDKAFELYRNRSATTSPTSAQATEFRRLLARDVDVTMIGVWDTVGALGIPLQFLKAQNAAQYNFHDVTLSSHVKFAYHALAIDEQRRPFAPALWEQQPEAATAGQVLEQTWFAGVHSNVGGGYAQCGASDTTFLWMAARARKAGLELDDAYIKDTICSARWDAPLRDSFDSLYELEGRYIRPIAEGLTEAGRTSGTFDARHEWIDESALERFRRTAGTKDAYRPANLVDFLKRFPSATQPDVSGP